MGLNEYATPRKAGLALHNHARERSVGLTVRFESRQPLEMAQLLLERLSRVHSELFRDGPGGFRLLIYGAVVHNAE